MREGWLETTLGEIANVNSESTAATSPDLVVRYVDIASVSEAKGIDEGAVVALPLREAPGRARRRVRTGDVLVSTVRPYLRAFARVPASFDGEVASTGFAVLRASDTALPGFIWCLVRTNNFVDTMMARATGSNYPAIRPKDVANFTFWMPPLREQHRIVDLMRAVDEYITAADKHVETAKTARGALLADLLSNPGDDWVETMLGTHVILSTGKLDVNAGVEGGQYPFFTCARNPYWIDVAAFSGASVLVAGNGDLNVKYYDGQFNAYQRTYVLQPRSMNTLNARFLFLFMCVYVDTLRSHTQGSTIQYLKKSQFTEAPINLPPIAEQKRIVDLMRVVDDEVTTATKVAKSARHARAALLSDLLSGDHEIPASYDRFLEAA